MTWMMNQEDLVTSSKDSTAKAGLVKLVPEDQSLHRPPVLARITSYNIVVVICVCRRFVMAQSFFPMFTVRRFIIDKPYNLMLVRKEMHRHFDVLNASVRPVVCVIMVLFC